MNAKFKNYTILSLVFLSFLYSYFIYFEKDTLAIEIFFNGIPTVESDIQQPNDDFFGGSNSVIQPQIASADFTITTSGPTRNTINTIFGGGRSVVGISNTIIGDVHLNVQNTNTSSVYGGSYNRGGLVSIIGSVYMNISNSNFTNRIYGGSKGLLAGYQEHIAGSIYMNLNHIISPLVYGVGNAEGTGPNHIAVGGDVNITITDSQIGTLFLVSRDDNVNVAGNVSLHTTGSTFNFISGMDSTIFGNLTMNIGTGTKINQNLILTKDGNIFGPITVNITDAVIDGDILLIENGHITGPTDIHMTNSTVHQDVLLGPYGTGSIGPVTFTAQGSTFNHIAASPDTANGLLDTVTVSLNNCLTHKISLGFWEGKTNTATVTISNGYTNLIDIGGQGELTLGIVNIHGGNTNTINIGGTTDARGSVGTALLNISGGDINTINSNPSNSSIITFQPWGKSFVRKAIDGLVPVDRINIAKHARTQWGTSGETFPVKTRNFTFTGELFITQEARLDLTILENFTVDGGIIIPNALSHTITPIIQLTGGPQSMLTINQPLMVILTFSPETLSAKSIPLAVTTPEFAYSEIFTKKNRDGLIWSDTVFDSSNNTWFLTNIKPTEDFYAFSAAREATNWLRQQHTWSIQRRANQLLEHGMNGLWINVQGGYEKLDAAIGTAKMPWTMASMGYDFLHTLPSSFYHMKAIYGFGLGISKGNDKWSTVNTTKNNIFMGMLAGYAGLMHDSGIYGTATLQFAANSIITKCSGFSENYKWKEIIPTEAFEFGWRYVLENEITITPRGQIIFEQLTKNHFKLPYENDTAVLEKSFLTTTIVGISGEYEFHLFAPMNLQVSLDWIQGLTGDFAAKSRLLKMKFKDKNDTSVIRTSLGLNSQLKEDLSIQCNIFTDIGNDKGIGGQIGATYTF